jgi:hypothetical protein
MYNTYIEEPKIPFIPDSSSPHIGGRYLPLGFMTKVARREVGIRDGEG